MKKTHVLIVEDDTWMAEQYARVLEKAGYSSKVLTNAFAAIDYIDDKKPDVIILDVLLPGSNAFALMHEIQSYSDTRKTPIILCTNLAPDIEIDDVAPYGVRRILDKALMEPSDVVAAVRSVT